MRAGRLVAMLLHLQHGRGATAAQLAQLLEVSERTVYRDVASLQEAGVPLWTEPGPAGGIRLLEGWRTRLDGLTGDEAAALFLAGAPTAVADLGLGGVLAAAQSKVLSTLPPELRGRAGRVRERFHLDAPGRVQPADTSPLLAPLAQAVWAAERVDIGYRRGSGDHAAARVVSRRLDPLGLVLKGGVWYLAARHRGRVRSYRVNRITRAEPLGSRFERPAAFDLAAWWAASTAEFDWAILRASVELRLSPWACRHLPSTVPGDPTRQALAAGIDDGGGWRRLTLPVESEDVAFHQLLALGGGVEVLAPVTLRRRLAAEGAAMVARNATG